MKNEKEINEQSINVPGDMLIDVLSIIVKEKLPHEVIQVIENRSIIVLAVSFDKSYARHQHILQNIQDILQEYNDFRHSEAEQINWRTNS